MLGHLQIKCNLGRTIFNYALIQILLFWTNLAPVIRCSLKFLLPIISTLNLVRVLRWSFITSLLLAWTCVAIQPSHCVALLVHLCLARGTFSFFGSRAFLFFGPEADPSPKLKLDIFFIRCWLQFESRIMFRWLRVSIEWQWPCLWREHAATLAL